MRKLHQFKKITSLKDNAALITNFGTMYINFDDYLPYSGPMFDFFINIKAILSAAYYWRF